jgi:eukaryotic-like serine/threonine-protein kinase
MSMIGKELYQFGPFSLDPAERVVSRDGTPLSLTPKVFDTLVCLVRSHGRLLTKDELLKEIWRDTFVEEVNLAVNISTLRKMLGEGPQEGRYILTVPGRGYRFVAAVQKVTNEEGERSPSGGDSLVASPEVDLGTTEHPSEEIDLQKSNRADYSVASIARAIRTDLPPRQENILLGRSPTAPSAKVTSGGLRWWIAAIVVVLAIAVLSGRGYFHLHRTPKITEKDTLVLSDFANSTGDPVFDDTLRQGLSVQLEQSPFLSIISDNKINQTLKMMGHPAGDRLTPEVTREVCQRMGSKAMLTGSIAGLDKQYVIGLKGVNCESGDLLTEAQEQAASKEGVLKALDAAAVHLWSKLGESLGTVQEYATPLENATTPSLEALKAYSLGRKTRSAKGDDAALPFYKRAIELDPNFAYAYLSLAVSYFNLNETGLAAEYSRKAYELREKGERAGTVRHRSHLLQLRDWGTGKGGEYFRTVAADLSEKLFALHGPRSNLQQFGILRKSSQRTTRCDASRAE